VSSAPPDGQIVAHAARLLRAGKLVAFPTETVYGLGADADNVEAVGAIFAAKGRPSEHPVIVHVRNIAAAQAWAGAFAPQARALAESFWPGPLTLVVSRAPRAHDAVTGGQSSVGLRCPSHPWARALLDELCRQTGDLARAIAAPSANRFGRISPTRAEHVRADLGEKPDGAVDLIVDGGPCTLGIESAIVDCTGPVPRLLRPGSIERDRIETALGRPLEVPSLEDGDVPRAPGRATRHYSPRRPLEFVNGAHLPARVRELGAKRVAVLASIPRLAEVQWWWVAPESPHEFARQLYDLLHQMDASGADRLLVQRPPAGPAWAALNDRLERAAQPPQDRFGDAD